MRTKDRSIKNYVNGKERIERRLDIIKLIRYQFDIDVLKKLVMTPAQRSLFKKQRGHVFRVHSGSSSSSGDGHSGDSDTNVSVLAHHSEKGLLNTEHQTDFERKLLLGIINREGDFEPRKKTKKNSAGTILQDGAVTGQSIVNTFNVELGSVTQDAGDRNISVIRPVAAKISDNSAIGMTQDDFSLV